MFFSVQPMWPPIRYILIFLLVLFYFRAGVLCLHVCICTMYVPGSLGGQRKALGPLKLELPVM